MVYTIHDAAADGNLEGIRKALEKCPALANAKDNQWTPLHYAAEGGHAEVAELLITKGADVNARATMDGRTALHWAAFYGHIAVAEVLVTRGADANAKDDEGDTPLQIAQLNEHMDLANLLREHGG